MLMKKYPNTFGKLLGFRNLFQNATFEIFTQCVHYVFVLLIISFISVKFRELFSILLESSAGKNLLLAEKVDAVSCVPPSPGSISLHGGVVKNRGC